MELTKRDLYNAKNASAKLEKGLEFVLTAVGSYPDKDKDGNEVNVTVLKAEDGTVYTTISNIIFESLDMLTDILTDEGKLTINVTTKKSAGGREYFQLIVK